MSRLRLSLPSTLAPLSLLDAGRATLGAMLGLAIAGVVTRLFVTGQFSLDPLLVAPIGASATLVFAIPASPLAQPRAVIGGNVVSGLAGLAMALILPHPLLAAVGGAGAAIGAMLLTRTLHPSGGAIGLGAGLAGAVSLADAGHALLTIGSCSALLTLVATGYLTLTGRSYPHRVVAQASPHATADVPPRDRVGFTAADLDTALAQYGELLDVSREDLDALFRQVELQAHRRIHSRILCEDIMSRDVISVDLDQSSASALAFLRLHDLRTAPVIDERRRVVGLVRRAELQAGRDRPVAQVLDPFVHKVAPGAAIETLLPLLSTGATHEAMVVDAERRLVGIVTQTDLLAVLYRAHVVEAVVAERQA